MRGALPPLPQYAFMAWYSVKAQGQLYLYVTLYKLLVCADGISLWSENRNSTEENKLLHALREGGLEVNAQKTKHVVMSRHQNAC
jgi:hypothetical protein